MIRDGSPPADQVELEQQLAKAEKRVAVLELERAAMLEAGVELGVEADLRILVLRGLLTKMTGWNDRQIDQAVETGVAEIKAHAENGS